VCEKIYLSERLCVCMCVIMSRVSVGRYIYVCENIHVCTYLCVYISMCVYLCMHTHAPHNAAV